MRSRPGDRLNPTGAPSPADSKGDQRRLVYQMAFGASYVSSTDEMQRILTERLKKLRR